MANSKSKHISFRCTPTDITNLKTYMHEQGIKKRSKAVQQIVHDFFTGGFTGKPQNLVLEKAKPELTSEGKPQPHVSVRQFQDSPMLKREVQRFMRGVKSPIIEGLLSIDDLSLRNARIAGNESGIIMLIPATTHDTGAKA